MLFFVFRVYFDLVAGNWGTSGEWDGHSVEVGGEGGVLIVRLTTFQPKYRPNLDRFLGSN